MGRKETGLFGRIFNCLTGTGTTVTRKKDFWGNKKTIVHNYDTGTTKEYTHGQGFLGNRCEYCRKVLNGTVKDEQYFIFMCCAPQDENGDVDFTNPDVHEMANPAYGVTIRPQEIMNDAMQALNDPQERKDFFAKSLNVFTTAVKAYFDIEEFRRSDNEYNWTLEELAKLPINWYGGADLSRMFDLTAAALVGMYKDTLIVITHAFFPITQAVRKADEDNIPLFGWRDDGWLTICNSETVNYSDVVDWFKEMRSKGFNVKVVGQDRKFARELSKLGIVTVSVFSLVILPVPLQSVQILSKNSYIFLFSTKFISKSENIN